MGSASTPYFQFRHFLAALMVSLLISCAGSPTEPPMEPPTPPWATGILKDHPLVGRVFVPAENKFISSSEAVRLLAAADFVLLGEKHDNNDHHRLQAWLIKRMIALGRRPAVVMEMIDTDKTADIAAYLHQHPGDAAGLGAALHWDKSGWPSWDMYRPIAEAVFAVGLPLSPGNLPRAVSHGLTHKDATALAQVQNLGLDLPQPPAAATGMALEIRDGHCNLLPEDVIPAMVLTQQARNATLAAVMAEPRPDGAVLIAGSGHVRSDWGVPARLRVIAANRSVRTLAFVEVNAEETEAAAYGQSFGAAVAPFDFLWFTPRLDNDDPCGKLADGIKQKL